MDTIKISDYDFHSLWEKYSTKFEGKKQLSLLKEIEKVTAEIFKTDPFFEADRNILVPDKFLFLIEQKESEVQFNSHGSGGCTRERMNKPERRF
jgi:hypothetical protein